jgi:hypothetical protein
MSDLDFEIADLEILRLISRSDIPKSDIRNKK